jgi:hypothetical protein
MRKAMFFFAVGLLAATPAFGEWIEVEQGPLPLSVDVLDAEIGHTVIEYQVTGFQRDQVEIEGDLYDVISLGKESKELTEGYPELPNVCRSVILPDVGRVNVRLVESTYQDISGVRVAPSKGNLLRTVNPENVPYTFSPFYGTDGWYPEVVATHRDPYIFRDFRGAVVILNPFQFNPATQTLRVYTHVVVEVTAVVGQGMNEFERLESPRKLLRDFNQIYEEHFINHDPGRYDSVAEDGTMLVICYDPWTTNLEPLVDWKNQMGLYTEMVTVTQAGGSATGIDNYIDQYFTNPSNDLSFVLLVGDYLQCPTPTVGSAASDPEYSLITGSDTYPEIFIGRFSAENTIHLDTQVERTIEYESEPQMGASWYHKGFGIGSAEGTGDDGEYDWEHIDNIRTDLLNYTYTEVAQIYDPGATAAMVSNAVNAGTSIGNYCGHGSITGWSTTGFSVSNANTLVNDNMLPFICSVACNTGEFDGYTCLAEGWLRATNNGNGEPTGGIGFYGSTISQSWSPPMCAQDELVDLLVQDEKRTFGALCFNGSCQMMDEYGTSGVTEFRYWTVFGDPSLQVRTDSPSSMTVLHEDAIDPELPGFPVTVVGVSGARCCISVDGTYYGHGFTDGSGYCEIPYVGTLPEEGMATLTVTGYNRAPYITELPLHGAGPDRPTGLAATPGDAQVLLAWDANLEPELSHYVIYRGRTSLPTDSLTAVMAPDTDYLDLAVQNDSTYYYRIKAFDVEGNGSLYSTEVSAMPMAPPVIFITHTPLTDTDDSAHPYPVTAEITTTEASLDPDSLFVVYEAFRGWEYAQMLPTGNPDEFAVDIPAQTCGTVVDYFIMAVDENHNRETHPDFAPATSHSFQVTFTPVYSTTFESGTGGWTVGAGDDDASTGVWEWCDPNATFNGLEEVQPEDDHTDPGVYCFITGQSAPGDAQGDHDVDGGKTTLFSPIIDLSSFGGAVVQYYRWFTNDTGNDPGVDEWKVDVSNNGGTSWTNLETTNVSDRSWLFRQHDLGGITLTSQMQFRFVAADEDPGSIVEAGVDDFSVLGCPQPGDTEPPTVTVLAPNGGEELQGTLEYSIQWDADDNIGVTAVNISLSYDGGLSFTETIAEGEVNDSEYLWTVPDVDESNCVVRIDVRDASSNWASDTSDDPFTIVSHDSEAPTLALMKPNGGETLPKNTPYEIKFHGEDNVGVVETRILFSVDSGITYAETLATGPYDSTFLWTTPDKDYETCRIKVMCRDAAWNWAEDESDADFRIRAATGVAEWRLQVPTEVSLSQNTPNPFNPVTEIEFGLPAESLVSLSVYDVHGRLVRTLATGVYPAGYHSVIWQGRDSNGAEASSGIYFYRMTAGEKVLTKKMMMLK